MQLRSPHARTLATALVVVLTGCDLQVRPGTPGDRPDFVVAGIPDPLDLPSGGRDVANDLWNLARTGGTAEVDARVCVIDSGVDLDHPDLRVSRERSRSFISKGPEIGDPDDYNGHGTHVAGIIAALDNGVGTTGIASGATIVALKVVDSRGRGYTADVLEAIHFVSTPDKSGEPRCSVVNFSIGAARSPEVDKAVLKAAKRVPFVVSAGNRGRHVSAFSPAALDAKGVTVVTA
ncbi:MAG: S8 family serine peptidase, partial [Rhodothermales bacterium]|nr:S8 family serine peptidase [Rhodothermales bacterium]